MTKIGFGLFQVRIKLEKTPHHIAFPLGIEYQIITDKCCGQVLGWDSGI